MRSRQRDYSIFDEFNFERKPVGVKYSLKKPDGINQLNQSLALCEMFKEAQNSKPFYATKETVQCGDHVVGMEVFPPIMYSGQLGPMFSMFKNPGANRKIYDYVPILPRQKFSLIIHKRKNICNSARYRSHKNIRTSKVRTVFLSLFRVRFNYLDFS